jgi:hypothetical protein
VLTNIASGAGLAKTWLAEPEDANRATSLTMAEPVRRRVGGVQKVWLAQQTELVRFASTGRSRRPAAGRWSRRPTRARARSHADPGVAGGHRDRPGDRRADAQLTAQVLLNLSTGLEKLVRSARCRRRRRGDRGAEGVGGLRRRAVRARARHPDANPDDVATAVDERGLRAVQLRVHGGRHRRSREAGHEP